MPHFQVALLHAFMNYDRQYDEVLALQNLPSWEAYPKGQAFFRKFKEQVVKVDRDAPAIPLGRYFLPGIVRVLSAQIRVDRHIAALRVVEAIRLYASAHGGNLPKSLGEMKHVTLPVDPLTGKAFEDEIVENTTLLKRAVLPETKR